MVTDQAPRLMELRDLLMSMSTGGDGDAAAIQTELNEIASSIETLSGAPVAVSIAWEAARSISDTPASYKHAGEILTVGLSAAH